MRGPSPNIQRALGWIETYGAGPRHAERDVPCGTCKSSMRFDAPDPQRLGRVFQYCPNPTCREHEPKPLERILLPS